MTDSTRPTLRVISGNATDEEIAALIAVFAAVGGPDEGEAPVAGSQWAAPARLHRPAVHPGPTGSWWASGLPR